MTQLEQLPGIQHLLGDDAQLLGIGRNRYNDVIVLVDTGRHREGAGRYVTWIFGHGNGCLLGHYFNDRQAAVRDLQQRTIEIIPAGSQALWNRSNPCIN